MTKQGKIDKVFLGLAITLILIGVFVFISASLNILAKDESQFYNILFNQLVLGLIGGIILSIIAFKIDYLFWRKYSLYFFIFSILLCLLVFAPGLSLSHGGASRWVDLGLFSFQPVEFLKFSFIMYFASWLSSVKNKSKELKYALLPFIFLLGAIALILFKQPDTKSFILILISAMAMLLVYGVPWKYIFSLLFISIVGLMILVYFNPYLFDRIETFLDPSRDPTGSSYQVEQSLITLGSGGLLGRGFGQSIQKFGYLPEPQGDSIFAVFGEEFGFVGGVFLIILFVFFVLRGLRIGSRSGDLFSKLLVTGIIVIIATQSFMNIASITGVFPLTGVPLPFISHGGTSLLLAIGMIGIILNISKHQKSAVNG